MSGDTQPFDTSYLNQVFQGNKALVIEIIEMFLEQVPNFVKLMEDYSREGNFSAIQPLAHKSKSSSSMLGLKSIESILIDIEMCCKLGKYDSLPEKIQALREQLNLCTEQITKYVTDQK